jgi:hypothetical protein
MGAAILEVKSARVISAHFVCMVGGEGLCHFTGVFRTLHAF